MDTLRSRRKISIYLGFFCFWTLCVVLFDLFELSDIGEYFKSSISRPVLFELREMLGRGSSIDHRLKILSFDDTSFERLQSPEITIEDWVSLIKAIELKNPRAIIIDKVFAVMFDPFNKGKESLQKLGSLKTKLVVAGFAKQTPILNRDVMPHETLSNFTTLMSQTPLSQYRLNSYQDWSIYSSTAELQKFFPYVGHVHYRGDGYVSSVLKLDDQRFFPHISLYACHSPIMLGETLKIDDQEVPLDSEGRILVDFIDPKKFYAKNIRLEPILRAAKEGLDLDFLNADDVVLILPNMFTGSTDIKMTPFGEKPGGFILASVINSVLKQSWLRTFEGNIMQSILAVVLGLLLVFVRRFFIFWMLFLGGVVGGVLITVYFFIYHNIYISSLAPLLGFVGMGVGVTIIRSLFEEKKTLYLLQTLRDADEVAKAFMPDALPEWKGLRIASFHKPLSKTSGDWFAFVTPKTPQLYHFILCDIIAHGVQSALIVSTCKTVLNFIKQNSPDKIENKNFLSDYASLLNKILFEQGEGRHLVTYLGVSFSINEKKIYYTSAGHPPALLVMREDYGRVKLKPLLVPTTVLGYQDGITPVFKEAKFTTDSQLITYTDGVPIVRNQKDCQPLIERDMPFEEKPEFLFKELWKVEYRKRKRRPDDDASLVWFMTE